MRFFEGVRKHKKRITVVVLSALAIALAFRGITEQVFLAQASIAGAFQTLKPDESRGTVTLTARYLPPPYGFSEEKLLNHFAENIGLYMDGEPRRVTYEGREELVYEKEAAQAHSTVKLVCLKEAEQYYLCAEITLYGKNAVTASAFREDMEQKAKEMKLSEISTTLELCGIYKGEIPLAGKDELTDGVLSELYAQPMYENRENKNYTVYAYTGAVKDYIVVGEKKINVQVAIYYDRAADCTEVVLASPIGLR